MTSVVTNQQPYVIGNSSYVCQFLGESVPVNSKGFFLGDNPMFYSLPLLLLQLSVISLVTYATHYVLLRLGQSSVVSQILAGILLGPSVLGRFDVFQTKVFPKGSRSTLESIAAFGVIFFLFQMGIKTNTGLIRECGKKAIVIGIMVVIVPVAFTMSMAFLLTHFVDMDKSLSRVLPMIGASQGLTGFVVVTCHLTELKMVNTDLGRLAVSSAMVADVIGIMLTAGSLALQQSKEDPLDAILGIVSTISMVAFIVCVIRPITLWMIKQTPLGESAKEGHIFSLFVAILLVTFMSETIGQHFILGPLVLGLALPDGPPLGAELVAKLDSLVSHVLFPTYLAVSGLKTNMYSVSPKSIWIISVVVIFAFLVKTTASMLPCLYNHMPLRDSFVFSLTMNVKGIVELLIYNIWKDTGILGDQEFALSVISSMVLTAVISPLMVVLYDPTKRFVSSKKNTIQHARPNSEIRILICVHKQESVPSVINILDISHPTVDTPISVVVLQLVELLGRSAPILVAHQPDHNFMCGTSRTQNVVNAFKQFEMQNQGLTSILPYTAIAHFATMHDDICNLAIDKKVNFVITPFHKEWAIDGKVGHENRSIRTMNIHLLEKSPCSVGIFVDRNLVSGSLSVLTSRAFYRVGVIFMGGADDGEVLAYGARMAEHPQVTVTIIRFLAFGCDNARDRKDENDIIDEFKRSSSKEIQYKEQVVRDGEGITAAIRSMGTDYDLVMVGKHHKHENRLLAGLNEWNECPELGILGDMLASSDFRGMCSVLVVQQARVRPGMRNRSDSRELLIHDVQLQDNRASNDGAWRIAVDR